MRNLSRISGIVAVIILLYYCKKEKEPTLTTAEIGLETKTTAIGGGIISSDGGLPVIDRGVCWSTEKNPTISLTTKTSDGTGTGEFASRITGLSTRTQYYVRAFATNSERTVYGPQVGFYTYYGDQTGTVKDIVGNIYTVIIIGTQTWMREDLRTSMYNDGTQIPPVTDNTGWSNLTTPGYLNGLYNWYTVNTGKLCPTGWHVPTESDWQSLLSYIGDKPGRSLKATDGWRLNTGNNETNFSARPNDNAGLIKYMNGYWWGTNDCQTYAFQLSINYLSDYVGFGCSGSKQYGYSVRCLKDF
jgi:uncharacterized protein (TIGR02145 family)